MCCFTCPQHYAILLHRACQRRLTRAMPRCPCSPRMICATTPAAALSAQAATPAPHCRMVRRSSSQRALRQPNVSQISGISLVGRLGTRFVAGTCSRLSHRLRHASRSVTCQRASGGHLFGCCRSAEVRTHRWPLPLSERKLLSCPLAIPSLRAHVPRGGALSARRPRSTSFLSRAAGTLHSCSSYHRLHTTAYRAHL